MERERQAIRGVQIDVLSWDSALDRIEHWANQHEPRTVAICNVHSVITAGDDARLRTAINEADMATPDGMPVAWLLSRRLRRPHPRVNGPDLTLRLCERAAQSGLKVAFYGGSAETIELLTGVFARQFPTLQVVLAQAPPMISMDGIEQDRGAEAIRASGAQIAFIGLGCPKQEAWMHTHVAAAGCVLIGVGAAFDYIAGTVRRPPVWMQRAGLEWFGRLLAEPRRLWRRYFYTNSLFVAYVLRELLGLSRG